MGRLTFSHTVKMPSVYKFHPKNYGLPSELLNEICFWKLADQGGYETPIRGIRINKGVSINVTRSSHSMTLSRFMAEAPVGDMDEMFNKFYEEAINFANFLSVNGLGGYSYDPDNIFIEGDQLVFGYQPLHKVQCGKTDDLYPLASLFLDYLAVSPGSYKKPFKVSSVKLAVSADGYILNDLENIINEKFNFTKAKTVEQVDSIPSGNPVPYSIAFIDDFISTAPLYGDDGVSFIIAFDVYLRLVSSYKDFKSMSNPVMQLKACPFLARDLVMKTMKPMDVNMTYKHIMSKYVGPRGTAPALEEMEMFALGKLNYVIIRCEQDPLMEFSGYHPSEIAKALYDLISDGVDILAKCSNYIELLRHKIESPEPEYAEQVKDIEIENVEEKKMTMTYNLMNKIKTGAFGLIGSMCNRIVNGPVKTPYELEKEQLFLIHKMLNTPKSFSRKDDDRLRELRDMNLKSLHSMVY